MTNTYVLYENDYGIRGISIVSYTFLAESDEIATTVATLHPFRLTLQSLYRADKMENDYKLTEIFNINSVEKGAVDKSGTPEVTGNIDVFNALHSFSSIPLKNREEYDKIIHSTAYKGGTGYSGWSPAGIGIEELKVFVEKLFFKGTWILAKDGIADTAYSGAMRRWYYAPTLNVGWSGISS